MTKKESVTYMSIFSSQYSTNPYRARVLATIESFELFRSLAGQPYFIIIAYFIIVLSDASLLPLLEGWQRPKMAVCPKLEFIEAYYSLFPSLRD